MAEAHKVKPAPNPENGQWVGVFLLFLVGEGIDKQIKHFFWKFSKIEVTVHKKEVGASPSENPQLRSQLPRMSWPGLEWEENLWTTRMVPGWLSVLLPKTQRQFTDCQHLWVGPSVKHLPLALFADVAWSPCIPPKHPCLAPMTGWELHFLSLFQYCRLW